MKHCRDDYINRQMKTAEEVGFAIDLSTRVCVILIARVFDKENIIGIFDTIADTLSSEYGDKVNELIKDYKDTAIKINESFICKGIK